MRIEIEQLRETITDEDGKRIDYEYTGEPLWYHAPIKALLPYVAKLCSDNDITFWLDWGTLIGAVENGKIIPWDFDIDLGIFHDDVEKLLSLTPQVQKDGYDFSTDRNSLYARKVRFYGVEDGFAFHIDLDPWVLLDGIYKATFDLTKLHTVEELTELNEIEFEGVVYPCPKDPAQTLLDLYGDDWMVPKVGSGNVEYIRKYAPGNTDICAEMRKHASWH